jgi:hypothetical protein
MPKLLQARPAVDAREARQVHKLATSTHAPADWIFHAKMIQRSWEGARTTAIAAELRCHAQTVRERLQAVNERGLEGLGMRPGGWTEATVDRSGTQHDPRFSQTPPARQAGLRAHGGVRGRG